jgi:tRNA dimethylallyltransferase
VGDAPERPWVPTIVGPTATGKTALADALAAYLPVTVISADARQVYRGLDIGTAKPDASLQARVPHRGVDLIAPGERYSAGRFGRDAAEWIEAALRAARQPVVVGGTGLYVRALAEGLSREPPLEPDARDALRRWTAGRSGPDLVRWAARLDPRFGGGGRQRAARAIEVALLTGRSLTWWQGAARTTGVMRPWYIHLTLPREALYRRITHRVDRMLAAGWVDEVRGVLARGVPPDAPGLDGVGYREVVAVLTGTLAETELRDAIIRATRRYAKRQATWFRHQLRADHRTTDAGRVWTLDATDEPERLAGEVIARWRSAAAGASPAPGTVRA